MSYNYRCQREPWENVGKWNWTQGMSTTTYASYQLPSSAAKARWVLSANAYSGLRMLSFVTRGRKSLFWSSFCQQGHRLPVAWLPWGEQLPQHSLGRLDSSISSPEHLSPVSGRADLWHILWGKLPGSGILKESDLQWRGETPCKRKPLPCRGWDALDWAAEWGLRPGGPFLWQWPSSTLYWQS